MTASIYKMLSRDSMRNFLAGFGMPGKDKAASQRFVLDIIDQDQLQAAYRCDWLSRKIVDIPAFDSCRAWREWEADNEQIEKIEEAEKNLGLQRKLMQALIRARLYGGAAMLIGIDGQKFEDELDPESVGKDDLTFVHVVSRYEIEAGALIRDITSPWFGEPSYYKRTNPAMAATEKLNPPLEESGLGYKPGSQLTIHPSRVVKLVGLDYPDLMQSPDPWGDSALQPVIDAIRAAGLVNSSIAAMIAEAKLDVIKVPGLLEMVSTEAGTEKLKERFSFSMSAKSTVNTTLIDGAEEWERIALAFSNMDAVMGMYLSIASGAADIPATRLLGKSPDGMNATGDSDTRNYYDRLASDQVVRLQPALTRLDEVLIRHALGSRPDEVHYKWKPLWQMDEAQKSEVWLRKAQTHKIDVDTGLINPDILREVRANMCIEDGFYPGFEAAQEEFDLEPDEDEHDQMDLLMQKQQMVMGAQPQMPGRPMPGRPPPGPSMPKANGGAKPLSRPKG
jgi:phage-related protein (TIGR01555 family)